MKVDPENLTVSHNREANRFEIRVDTHLAMLKYRLQDGIITFTHTGVPRELEGQGVGSKLARAGLDYAQENRFQVQAHCSFVASYLKRHPEYQSLEKE